MSVELKLSVAGLAVSLFFIIGAIVCLLRYIKGEKRLGDDVALSLWLSSGAFAIAALAISVVCFFKYY